MLSWALSLMERLVELKRRSTINKKSFDMKKKATNPTPFTRSKLKTKRNLNKN